MSISEEEYLMDFKAEERKTHRTVFDAGGFYSDCTTISASEVESDGCNSPTPPLLCKLREARVMVKKLPNNGVERYNLRSRQKTLPSPPKSCSPVSSVRTSKRLESKQIPGQYLSLHINKPLNVIMKKKKISKARAHSVKAAEQQTTENSQKKSIISRRFPRKFKLSTIKLSSKKAKKLKAAKSISKTARNLLRRERIHDKKVKVTQQRTVNKSQKSKLPNSHDLNRNNQSSATQRCDLHERIASTRLVNSNSQLINPASSTLPNYPEVVTTKCNLRRENFVKSHQNSARVPCSNLTNPFVNIPLHVAPSAGNNYVPNALRVSRPQHNINTQVPLPRDAALSNYSPMHDTQSSNVFPTLITTDPNVPNSIMVSRPQHNISTQVPLPYRTTLSNYIPMHNIHSSNVFPTLITTDPRLHAITCQPVIFNADASNSAQQRTFTVQTLTALQNHIPPQKVLIIDQAAIASDPLDTLNSSAKNINSPPIVPEVNRENSAGGYADAETDIELSDAEKEKEPEVIKRIIYHTKSVQTKFTCHSSICGIIDSEEFNLNCFYCYDIFPLYNWLEFKEHVKRVHHVEGKENQSPTKTVSKKDFLLNKDHDTTNEKPTSEKEKVFKKLPLEPRLVAQRLGSNTTPTMGSAEIQSSISDNPSSKRVESSSRSQLTNLNNQNNEIINLDGDDSDDGATKTSVNPLHEGNSPVKKKSNLNDRILRIDADSKVLLTSLPHITVKKIEQAASKEQINQPSQSTAGSSHLEKLIPNLNMQKLIKVLPKSKAKQLSSSDPIKPRYFVVKKIIKLPTTETIPNINLSKDVILKKIPQPKKDITNTNQHGEYRSSAIINKEDSVPRPTNGRGILFGVTNSMVVIEFLLNLKTFPELWRTQLKNNTSLNYNESIKHICSHLNNRFELGITDVEMRQSIQRVKDWYCRMLKNIHEHNQNLNNTQPYKHKFPLYFRILNQFLKSEVDYTYNSLFSSSSNSNAKGQNCAITQPTTTTQCIAATDTSQDMAIAKESLIVFDADTLYDDENNGQKVVGKSCHKFYKRRSKNIVGNFVCDMCNKTYKRVYELKRHKIMHFPPQFPCGVCSQKFYFKRSAEKCSHIKKMKRRRKGEIENTVNTIKRVWPKKIFRFKSICEICGASYRSIGSLNTHKKDKHLNQREKCIVCNFTAICRWRVVQHQKKRHIVEIGTVEEVAKKSRARTDTKTPFSNEARQEFFWRREMRNKLQPGERFYGCCKCRIIFNTRKEKVLHNKVEHPIKETTVLCLLCLPTKLLLSNSNCARRHYTDIHKVAWHEIDDLVKRTKPIFSFLSKEEIELLKASENYKELLDDLLKDKRLHQIQKVEILEDETIEAVHNLSILPNMEKLEVDAECSQENVFVDCIIDHDYNREEIFKEHEYANNNEHNYSGEQVINENFDIISNQNNNELYSNDSYDDGIIHLDYNTESNDNKIYNRNQNDHEYLQNNVDDLIEGELIEESIVIEECVDEIYEGEYF